MSATVSPKTGMTRGTLPSSASQPGAPTHLSGVPARREGGKAGLGLARSQVESRDVTWDWHAECSCSCVFCSSLPVSLEKVQSQLSVPFSCFFLKLENYVHGWCL